MFEKPYRTGTIFDNFDTVSDIVSNSFVQFTEQNIRLSLPAVITRNDSYENTQTVDVKLLIGVVYKDGTQQEGVNIKNVFVDLPEGNGFQMCFPCKVGDRVKLSWCHRDYSSWLDGDGNPTFSNEGSNFQLRDCYATLGAGTRRVNQNPSVDNFILRGKNSVTVITPSGEITTTCKNVTLNCESSTVNASNKVDFNTPVANFSNDVNVGGKLTVPTVEVSDDVIIREERVYNHDHEGNVPPFRKI